jgi:polyferredoxin
MTIKRKNVQMVMWWLLPLIIFVGIWWHYIGYIVLVMMIVFLTLSVFKGRYWCGWFCPRGSFLDRILKFVSMNAPIPSFAKNLVFRSAIFCGMIAFMLHRLIQTNGELDKIGFVFVIMCIATSIISIILGIIYNPRIWCAFCPMGTLQGLLGREKYILQVSDDCIECGLCEKVCPTNIDPGSFKESGKVSNFDCIKCSNCIEKCPRNALKFQENVIRAQSSCRIG